MASASLIGDAKTRKIDDVYPKLAALVTQQEIAAGREDELLSAELLKAKGVANAKVAVIEGAAGYAEVKQRTEGFEAGMKEAGQLTRSSQPNRATGAPRRARRPVRTSCVPSGR